MNANISASRSYWKLEEKKDCGDVRVFSVEGPECNRELMVKFFGVHPDSILTKLNPISKEALENLRKEMNSLRSLISNIKNCELPGHPKCNTYQEFSANAAFYMDRLQTIEAALKLVIVPSELPMFGNSAIGHLVVPEKNLAVGVPDEKN